MRIRAAALTLTFGAGANPSALAHSWHDTAPVSPAVAAARAELMAQFLAEQRAAAAATPVAGQSAGAPTTAALAPAPSGYSPLMAASFCAFKPRVRSYWDTATFYIEFDNTPDPVRMPNHAQPRVIKVRAMVSSSPSSMLGWRRP